MASDHETAEQFEAAMSANPVTFMDDAEAHTRRVERDLKRATDYSDLMGQLFDDQADAVVKLTKKLEDYDMLIDWMSADIERLRAENARLTKQLAAHQRIGEPAEAGQ